MTAPSFTVDVIEQALEQGLAVITLMQLRDALQSGEVAILTKADRNRALDKALTAGVADAKGYTEICEERLQEARTLLQLPVKAGAR